MLLFEICFKKEIREKDLLSFGAAFAHGRLLLISFGSPEVLSRENKFYKGFFVFAILFFCFDLFLLYQYFYLFVLSLFLKGIFFLASFERCKSRREFFFSMSFLFFSLFPLIYLITLFFAEFNFLVFFLAFEISALGTLCLIGFKKNQFSVVSSALFFFLGNIVISVFFLLGILVWYMLYENFSFSGSLETFVLTETAFWFIFFSFILKLGLFPGHT